MQMVPLAPDAREKGKLVEAAPAMPAMWRLNVIPFAATEMDELPCEIGGYGVTASVETRPELSLRTDLRYKNKFGAPQWDTRLIFLVEEPLEDAHLLVELVRHGVLQDPGGSNAVTVLGRARYRLNKLRKCEFKSALLFLTLGRPQGGYGGVIQMSAWLQPALFLEN